MDPLTLLVISDPAARHLSVLEKIPGATNILAGDDKDFLVSAAPKADVILNAKFNADLLREIWPLAGRLRWVHSLSAGVEQILFPELQHSPVPLTNGRGVFKGSLGEFAITGVLFFAKEIRRMLQHQGAGIWEQFDIEEVAGKVMGVAGYGEIGRSAAECAKALHMSVVAVRRRPELSHQDPLLDQVFPPDQLQGMMRVSDYVVVAAPHTPETRGMIGEPELRAMKSTAVIINVGRGPVIEESSLVRALQENWIRGAALDVFEQEPLPAGHPFYKMDNVLLSPHCADHTPDWLERAVQCFVDNFERFVRNQPLENIVDKEAGY